MTLIKHMPVFIEQHSSAHIIPKSKKKSFLKSLYNLSSKSNNSKRAFRLMSPNPVDLFIKPSA